MGRHWWPRSSSRQAKARVVLNALDGALLGIIQIIERCTLTEVIGEPPIHLDARPGGARFKLNAERFESWRGLARAA